MAYAVIHHFPGGTKANYEASVAAVHPGPNQLPKGQIAHVAGAVPGGSGGRAPRRRGHPR